VPVDPQLPLEVRVDPVAPKGDLVSALAALLLARARTALGERASRVITPPDGKEGP
jgi:hypothetical protein